MLGNTRRCPYFLGAFQSCSELLGAALVCSGLLRAANSCFQLSVRTGIATNGFPCFGHTSVAWGFSGLLGIARNSSELLGTVQNGLCGCLG